jgi:cytochrome c biogenesis protein CcdA
MGFAPFAQGLGSIPNPRVPLQALLSALGFGFLSGLGPCAAPRLLALTGFTHRENAKNAALLTGAFILGTAAVYAAIGYASSIAARLLDISPYLYAAVAVALGIAGIKALMHDNHTCGDAHERSSPPSIGSAFLFGGASASVASPCCTPLLFAMLASASQTDRPQTTVLLLASFAIGSTVPSVALAAFASRVMSQWKDGLHTHARSFGVVHAGLLLGIGAYYGILA